MANERGLLRALSPILIYEGGKVDHPTGPEVILLSDEWQRVAAIVFVVIMAVFAAWARTFGKREGPPTPKVQEFAVTG